MRTLAIDIETFSSVDLTSCGVYAYIAAPDFQILLFGYAWDDDPVEIIDLACGERLPDAIVNAIESPEVIKTAFYANFERTCLKAYFNMHMPPEQWRCTQVLAMSLGLPSSLEEVSSVMGLKEQKLEEGKKLIKYFSTPGGNLGFLEPDKESWERFKAYCIRDVEVEKAVQHSSSIYHGTAKKTIPFYEDGPCPVPCCSKSGYHPCGSAACHQDIAFKHYGYCPFFFNYTAGIHYHTSESIIMRYRKFRGHWRYHYKTINYLNHRSIKWLKILRTIT
jgi:hypothetical protein